MFSSRTEPGIASTEGPTVTLEVAVATDNCLLKFPRQLCLNRKVTLPVFLSSELQYFNINNYYAHYFKNIFAHKLYYYAYDSNVGYVPGSFKKTASCF